MRVEHIGDATLYLADCMDIMRDMPDKAFDIAIVDPPYGIGADVTQNDLGGKKGFTKNAGTYKKYHQTNWDNETPNDEYFNELKRVSKNQIIWGANHFSNKINQSSSCWIVWDKNNGSNGFADAELAFTTFDSAVRIFKYTWNGMIQQNMKDKEDRFHPTQKPVALYKWLLSNYAKPGDKILDTHLGSGSSRIAAYDMGFDFYATELDKDYFDAQEKRFQNFKSQLKLF